MFWGAFVAVQVCEIGLLGGFPAALVRRPGLCGESSGRRGPLLLLGVFIIV